jgi:tetratricopeptide (TPR) repeat protein
MQEIQQLQQRLAANPNDAEAVLRLANLNFEIGQWARARDLYQRYVGLGNENPDVLSDLGVTHRELGEYDQALELFRRAQRLDSNHWQSVFNEVVVLTFDLKQYDAANQAMARLQQMQPGNADVARLAAELDRLKSGAA